MAVTRPQGGTLGELLNRGVKPVTKSVNIISGEFQSAYIAQARYQNLFGCITLNKISEIGSGWKISRLFFFRCYTGLFVDE